MDTLVTIIMGYFWITVIMFSWDMVTQWNADKIDRVMADQERQVEMLKRQKKSLGERIEYARRKKHWYC